MATGIILCIIVIIFVFSIKSYYKKLSHGCCGAGGNDVKKIKPSDRNTSNYDFVYKVNIEGMTCNNCKKRVENSFNEKDGFYAVVNLRQKEAIVRAKHKVSEEDIKQIVQKSGYRVISVSNT
ncbi:MAG: heavy metal-associated domain-containing protein [Clostridium sp.]|nr:heavy metal-associated domain-containing protein [Clostridium sp.]